MKKQLTILFFIAFIVPSITMASWWNPFSWGKHEEQPEIAPKVEVESTTSLDATQEAPKPVIKTITVQDPALQKQINDLIAENASLKIQVASLNNQLNQIKNVPLQVVVAEKQCDSSIKVSQESDIQELVIAQGNIKTIVYKIHTESCESMDGKSIVLRINGQDDTSPSSEVLLSQTGSIKSGSVWKSDIRYTVNFTAANEGTYKYIFIFDGKEVVLPVKIVRAR